MEDEALFTGLKKDNIKNTPPDIIKRSIKDKSIVNPLVGMYFLIFKD